jgi:hypothetical protein
LLTTYLTNNCKLTIQQRINGSDVSKDITGRQNVWQGKRLWCEFVLTKGYGLQASLHSVELKFFKATIFTKQHAKMHQE